MSKKTPHSPLDLVTTLMQERVKFETWLRALDDRRGSTPANVLDRVRHDYERRLSDVINQLTEHASALEAQAEQYAARLAELAEREQARRDERAEAELRAHVGELSDDAWQVTAREADDALAAIAAEQAVVGADLTRVHELLGAATAPASTPVVPHPSVGHEPAPSAAAAAPAEHPVAGHPAPPPASARETPEQSNFDELAFLKSVVSAPGARAPGEGRAAGKPAAPPPAPRASERQAAAHAPPPPPPPPSAAAAPAPGAGESDPVVFHDQGDTLGEALASRVERAAHDGEFIREDPEDAAAGLVGRAREPGTSDRPFAANVTGNNPIVLRPSGAVEQPKTLKCAECGAMNYPTEWYCERCGAELASL